MHDMAWRRPSSPTRDIEVLGNHDWHTKDERDAAQPQDLLRFPLDLREIARACSVPKVCLLTIVGRSPAVLGPYRLQRLVAVAVNGNFRINQPPDGPKGCVEKWLASTVAIANLAMATLVYQRAPFLVAFPAFWRLVATYRSALYAVYGLSPPFPLPGSAAVPLPCIYSSPLLLALPTGSPHRWAASCTATDYIPLSVLRASDRSLASSQCALRLLATFHTLVASPRFLSPVRVPPHRGIPAAPFVLSTVCPIPWIAVCDIRIDPAPASAPSSAVQRKCSSSATDNSYTVIDVSRL
ncbi:hypothetical protein DFH06DRAFT_1467439 [Mycena polygramma]|nr:hypothetical protein DFH06DRAFT_1467439 [Mycena polygramma]